MSLDLANCWKGRECGDDQSVVLPLLDLKVNPGKPCLRSSFYDLLLNRQNIDIMIGKDSCNIAENAFFILSDDADGVTRRRVHFDAITGILECSSRILLYVHLRFIVSHINGILLSFYTRILREERKQYRKSNSMVESNDWSYLIPFLERIRSVISAVSEAPTYLLSFLCSIGLHGVSGICWECIFKSPFFDHRREITLKYPSFISFYDRSNFISSIGPNTTEFCNDLLHPFRRTSLPEIPDGFFKHGR